MIILGINAYHPNASVALLRDGVPIWAAEEERYNRIKHASGFPELALKRCLQETGIPASAIDIVAISKNPYANLLKKILFVLKNKPEHKFVFNRLRAFRASSHFERDFFEAIGAKPKFLRTKFIHVEHHLTHAASCFFLSGFDRAAFLSIDGMGDFSSAMWGIGNGNRIRVMDRVYFPHSAGFLYTAASQFLGFPKFGDEYKVMGLAAYGRPTYVEAFRHMVYFKSNGQFELNLSYFTHHEGHAKIRWEGGSPEQDMMYSDRWVDKFGMARMPGERLTDRDRNIAASVQAVLEEILFHILRHLHKKTSEKNLCLAGGVAFNSLANGKISRSTPFENVYIQPAAGDAGTALGATAFVHYSVLRKSRTFVMNHAYFGSKFSEKEIEDAVKAKGLPYIVLPEEDLVQQTIKDLVEGKVVGWFQGRMEFGPRALGNRSILVDPRRPEMQDILNERVKHREAFRPFAPAVLEEEAKNFFEMDCDESPFMLKVFPVRPEKRSVIPAVTHADGTSRVQTVSKKTNPLFWKLIKAFGDETGVPVLLNTSFNEQEPIVCTPQEALDCFLGTKMDVLVMGHCYLQKAGTA
ncbi:MAG: carbamoyltransferase [Candidatus Omnitrophica bacterium]|nr:carbamoyltransferase [Candidatus Omnitrophota bacterium]